MNSFFKQQLPISDHNKSNIQLDSPHRQTAGRQLRQRTGRRGAVADRSAQGAAHLREQRRRMRGQVPATQGGHSHLRGAAAAALRAAGSEALHRHSEQ